MPEANLNQPEWDLERPQEPFCSRAMRAGQRAGAGELGASLYEIDPGGLVSPYHFHHGNEEMLIVLDGRPALRTPAGTRRLEPGAVVAFPRGPGGAHGVSNPGPDPARVLLVSTVNVPDVGEYPDTGTVLIAAGATARWAFPAQAAEPVPAQVLAAARAAAALAQDASG